MRGAQRLRRAALTTAAALTLASACSDSGTTTSGAAPAGSDRTRDAAVASSRTPCTRPPEAPPKAVWVTGSSSDRDLTSFDGTTIRIHWFPKPDASATAPAPTVLMGPGWGLPGDTSLDDVDDPGAISISELHDAGFNVLTWDPRGFGRSTGTARVNDPDAEGRDVQVLIDWVAAQSGVQLDGAGDPRLGMVGGSYGGGIQLTTAAQDCRVDAIVPTMAWSSLGNSLYKGGIAKTGWAGILNDVAAGGTSDPHIDSFYRSATATGRTSDEDLAWYESRGPGDAVSRITAPTLIIQGTVDGLFTLDEGITNYRRLRDAGTPVSMVWFCGGHGVCLTDEGDPDRVRTAALAWLRRHVVGDTTVDTGPRVELLDQDGHRYAADDWPLPAGAPVTASGSGTLSLTAEGGSGPAWPRPGGRLPALLVLPVTPARAAHAVNVPVDAGATPAVIVGAPQLTITYSGTSPGGDRPQRAFAQLVDDATGVVVGNQVTPVPLTLDGATHTTTVPLETIAFTARPGAQLTLQLTPTTVAYAQPQLGGTVTFDQIRLSLPTAANLTPGG
ncbi:MAG: alpha/beta fold hydrolase [Acidimicrobiales bacterium]